MPPHRFAVVNALCLGVDALVDERIVESFERGFVTTATLLAYGSTATKAVALAHAAHRHDDSCFAGAVMSETEKEAAQREGTFHAPQLPPTGTASVVEEQKSCASCPLPASTRALPLGLMLTLHVTGADEQHDRQAVTAGTVRRKRSKTTTALPATASQPQQLSTATIERRVRQQIEWFTSLTGYPPLFVTAQSQFHTSSPYCELLARLLPLYAIRWVTFLEAASPSPPPHGHGTSRRSTLAQSRTARFVYGQHQLLAPQYELEWVAAHTEKWKEEVNECKRGVTEIHLRFDAHGSRTLDPQRAVLELCDQQQIVLVNHQQAACLSYVHPTLPATLHELSIPSHHLAPLEAAPSAWHTLPSDLIHAFHAFLSPASFLLSRRTCRAWQKRALLPGAMWSSLLFHVHPHLPSSTLSRLSETTLPIRKVRVTDKTVSAGSINELRSIGRLTHLTHLTLINCTGVTDGLKSGGDWIAGLRGLQHLTCDRCDLSDDSMHLFASLPALVTLELSECPLSQAAVATLAGCSFPHLTTLKLSERHASTQRTLSRQFSDEAQALSHILAATRALPPSPPADVDTDNTLDSSAVAAETASAVRWPRVRALDLTFSIIGYAVNDEFVRYVDAVHAFRRSRPQISLRTELSSG